MASGSNFGALGRVLDGPGRVRGGLGAPQERPKTAPRAEHEWGLHPLWRSQALLGAFFRFFTYFFDFGWNFFIVHRFWFDFDSILHRVSFDFATLNFATIRTTSRCWGKTSQLFVPCSRRARIRKNIWYESLRSFHRLLRWGGVNLAG